MLSTPLLTVFDVADDRGKGQPRRSTDLYEKQGWTEGPGSMDEGPWGVLDTPSSELCVSVAAFGILVASSTFLVTLSAAVLVSMLLLRSQRFHHALIRQQRHFASESHLSDNSTLQSDTKH